MTLLLTRQEVDKIPHTTQAILHDIKQVLSAPNITSHANWKTPVLQNKAIEGETELCPCKEMLGQLINVDHRTFNLTPDKATFYVVYTKKLLWKKISQWAILSWHRSTGQ